MPVREAVTRLPIPPHSVEAEQSVLGSLLVDAPRCWPLVSELRPDQFYRADHRLIFATIAALMRDGVADLVTVNAALSGRGQIESAGGLAYLGQLARDTTAPQNIERYADIVRERGARRALVELGRRLEAQALEGLASAETLSGQAAAELAAIGSGARVGAGLVGSEQLARDLLDDLDRRQNGAAGLSTGLSDFDELTGGLEAGELTIFAGRPAMGKTALLVTIAAHVARDTHVAVFSAEMPSLQLTRRCASLLGGVSQERLRRPKHMEDRDWAAVMDGAAKLAERHLAIDDRQMPTIEHIRAECLAHKARHGLGLIMIDYVQLVQAPGSNRYESLRDVAYGCKALAKELKLPVVVLAQLNRGVESRERKHPLISDLRDSGAIEEAADTIGMLFREDYYRPEFSMANIVECSLEKHRNGPRGQCLWHFAGEFSRMCALDEGARRQYRLLAQERG